MPTSVTGTYSGDADEFTSRCAAALADFLAALITIYIVLACSTTFVHPFTILTTLPSAASAHCWLMLWHDLMIGLIGIVL